MEYYATLILILIPLLTIPLLYVVPKNIAKHVALISAFGSLGAVLALYYSPYFSLCTCKNFQFVFNEVWVKSLGINLHFGIDGTSMLMLLLTNIVTPLVVLSMYGRPQGNTRGLPALILFMQAALVGVFMAMDSFVFYLFYELALIPVFFMILHWGGENKNKINIKFFIYTLTGSLLMLVAIIFLYLKTGSSQTFNIRAFYTLTLTAQEQAFVFFCFMAAFAVKIPLFPFHTWQPATYTTAPTQGTMMLSGVMLKMALYGMLRFVLPITPLAVQQFGPVVMLLAVIGVIYGAWIAIGQNNIKTLFAYSSLSHVGLIAAGMLTMYPMALQGSLFQMITHGINAVGLFMVADIIGKRLNTLELSKMGGIVKKAPVFSILFFIIVLGAVGMPLTNGFVGEFLLLLGLFGFNKYLAAVAGLTIIFGAVYLLNTYQKAMLGKPNELTENFTDLTVSETIVMLTVALIVIGTGVFPELFMGLTRSPVEHLISDLQNGALKFLN